MTTGAAAQSAPVVTSITLWSWLRDARVWAGCVLLAVCMLRTSQQIRVWRSSHTLWQHSLTVDPTDWRANALYSEYLVKLGASCPQWVGRRHGRFGGSHHSAAAAAASPHPWGMFDCV